MLAERGVIRNRQFAQQIRDFSGLRFGKITPTATDRLLEMSKNMQRQHLTVLKGGAA